MIEETEAKRFKATGSNASVNVICERHNAGEIAVCPKCDADLVVAFNWQDAQEHDGHPGIFCPTDTKHFQILFNVAAPLDGDL